MKALTELTPLLEFISVNADEFYETAPCGFIFTKPDGTFIKANQTFLNWINFSVEEIVDKIKFRDLLVIGSKIFYETNYSPLLKMQGFLNEVTLDLKNKNGGQIPILINSVELKGSDGVPFLIRSTLFDITDRRKYEKELQIARINAEESKEALKISNEWFSTTLKSIGDAVITINVDKTISYLNTVAEELTGWNLTEASGRPMDEIFMITNEKGNPAFNPVERVLKEGIVIGLEKHTALLKRNGAKIIIEDSAAPIRKSNGEITGVVLVFRDATEKYAEEIERLETLEQLREQRDMREKFVATLSHDLRSPLTAVKMSAQLLLRKADQVNQVQSLAVRVINGMERADQMIQDLLDANRISAGEKLTFEMEFCDLSSLLPEIILDLTSIHGDRFKLENDSKIEGHWNADGLRRVIENLCNNAVKYGSLRTPIKITAAIKDATLRLSVQNEGNPISEADQLNLFELYNRTSDALKSTQKGWGLGLTLVKEVATAHGGSVSVVSTITDGTTFVIQIPIDSRT